MLFDWTKLQQFFYMGGYALYVWLAYAIFLILLVVQALRVRLNKSIRKIQKLPISTSHLAGSTPAQDRSQHPEKIPNP